MPFAEQSGQLTTRSAAAQRERILETLGIRGTVFWAHEVANAEQFIAQYHPEDSKHLVPLQAVLVGAFRYAHPPVLRKIIADMVVCELVHFKRPCADNRGQERRG